MGNPRWFKAFHLRKQCFDLRDDMSHAGKRALQIAPRQICVG
jgi:hypothetical protein